MKQNHNFTEGKILGPLMRFAGPILLAMFLQSMYGAVDLLIVGKFASTVDVSAVATGSQMMHSITGVITGLAMGGYDSSGTVYRGEEAGTGGKSDRKRHCPLSFHRCYNVYYICRFCRELCLCVKSP